MSSPKALAATEAAAPSKTPLGNPRPQASRRRLLLVTGLAGAGRSTALKCLEDHGFEAVDNLPLALLPHLVSGVTAAGEAPRALAIGIDGRTRDFTAEGLSTLLQELKRDPALDVRLLFLDSDDETLRRRFTETRRRHPFAPDRPVSDGIAQERRLMFPLQQVADLVIDTSDRTIGDFKALLAHQLGLEGKSELAITILSFSYRLGLPREADLVFDVRFLDNPHYDPALRPLTGEDERVGRAVESDPAYDGFFAGMTGLLWPLLPGFEREGKSYLTIAIGCTGGRHRSVHVARRLAQWLEGKGRPAILRHRDLDRGVPDSGLTRAGAPHSGRG
ncbi:RNase adapter RapZ [Dongia sedimenti]|uniref:RNase adapter RapZ n=1 Tax=Dongia sedimenti TaxID=3064282 RepID=A0ABU0YQP9_9PROT|nr:RNase adapter RapZ [Rhodospirillaceae bacterium R-7]